jgi:hypothetical protein
MKKNMGSTDRIIRLIIAAIIAILYFFTDLIPGTLGVVLLVVAAIFVITSFFRFCGLYALSGITTCPVKESK